MIEFVGLRAKTYAYLMNDDNEHKKAKERKKCVIKRILTFNDYKNCQSNNKIILEWQQRFKSVCHDVCTEQISKIALSSNDAKRLQIFDKITTYPYGTNVFKVCESKMLRQYKWLISMIIACVRHFLSNFCFQPNDSPSKTMKKIFFFIQKALFVLEIFNFLYFHLPLFISLSPIVLEVVWR